MWFIGALNEMVDFVSVNRGIITEVIYPEGNYKDINFVDENLLYNNCTYVKLALST